MALTASEYEVLKQGLEDGAYDVESTQRAAKLIDEYERRNPVRSDDEKLVGNLISSTLGLPGDLLDMVGVKNDYTSEAVAEAIGADVDHWSWLPTQLLAPGPGELKGIIGASGGVLPAFRTVLTKGERQKIEQYNRLRQGRYADVELPTVGENRRKALPHYGTDGKLMPEDQTAPSGERLMQFGRPSDQVTRLTGDIDPVEATRRARTTWAAMSAKGEPPHYNALLGDPSGEYADFGQKPWPFDPKYPRLKNQPHPLVEYNPVQINDPEMFRGGDLKLGPETSTLRENKYIADQPALANRPMSAMTTEELAHLHAVRRRNEAANLKYGRYPETYMVVDRDALDELNKGPLKNVTLSGRFSKETADEAKATYARGDGTNPPLPSRDAASVPSGLKKAQDATGLVKLRRSHRQPAQKAWLDTKGYKADKRNMLDSWARNPSGPADALVALEPRMAKIVDAGMKNFTTEDKEAALSHVMHEFINKRRLNEWQWAKGTIDPDAFVERWTQDRVKNYRNHLESPKNPFTLDFTPDPVRTKMELVDHGSMTTARPTRRAGDPAEWENAPVDEFEAAQQPARALTSTNADLMQLAEDADMGRFMDDAEIYYDVLFGSSRTITGPETYDLYERALNATNDAGRPMFSELEKQAIRQEIKAVRARAAEQIQVVDKSRRFDDLGQPPQEWQEDKYTVFGRTTPLGETNPTGVMHGTNVDKPLLKMNKEDVIAANPERQLGQTHGAQQDWWQNVRARLSDAYKKEKALLQAEKLAKQDTELVKFFERELPNRPYLQDHQTAIYRAEKQEKFAKAEAKGRPEGSAPFQTEYVPPRLSTSAEVLSGEQISNAYKGLVNPFARDPLLRVKMESARINLEVRIAELERVIAERMELAQELVGKDRVAAMKFLKPLRDDLKDVQKQRDKVVREIRKYRDTSMKDREGTIFGRTTQDPKAKGTAARSGRVRTGSIVQRPDVSDFDPKERSPQTQQDIIDVMEKKKIQPSVADVKRELSDVSDLIKELTKRIKADIKEFPNRKTLNRIELQDKLRDAMKRRDSLRSKVK